MIGKKTESIATGLLSFFKPQGSNSEISDNIKTTLVLALGFACKHSKPEILCHKLEPSIINNILPLI